MWRRHSKTGAWWACGSRRAAAQQPHHREVCALSPRGARSLPAGCALSVRGALSSRTGVRSLPARGCAPSPRGGALSPREGVHPRGGALSLLLSPLSPLSLALSEARSLLLSPQCALSCSLRSALSPSPPQFSGSFICWVTRPIKVKVTCARSGQANHHTDHALSTRHPRTPGPITADFL